ncbi:MAG: MFS transporter [Chitinophagales bacterium]|nr:MFS transporter [Chitinophagales bacterium]
MKFPKGIPYIIGNEAAERYSFYGMKAILVIFLTEFLRNNQGELAPLSDEDAKFWYHIFVMVTYATPLLGAILADVFWGKYRTILRISVLYVIGHACLALWENYTGMLIGCGLIAFGAGGIKPCVSAHVGDQFDKRNSHLLEKIFIYFYFAINTGAFLGYLSGEWLLREISPTVAFGIPGIFMFIATVVFWLGRKKFVAVKPAGPQLYLKEVFSEDGRKRIFKLIPLYIFLAAFWSLYDQTGSAWVLQAKSDLMNKHVDLGFWAFDFYPSQIGFFNPLLILILIPIFDRILYPRLKQKTNLHYARKILIGMFLAVLPFALLSWVQMRMDGGIEMSILWQLLAYILITAAEIMISITALEFSYTQAPNKLKSFIMSFYFLSISLGNLFTAIVNAVIQKKDGSLILEGAEYYWFFTGLMVFAAITFILYDKNFKEETFLQSEEDLEVLRN